MKKYLVIGNPIEHSLSPKLHNYWFKKNNINAIYEKRLVDENNLKKLCNEVKNGKLDGFNVTVPFKKEIIPYIDQLSIEAKNTQSVNTISFNNGKLIGHNTDIDGFELSIKKLKFDVANKKILILGAGGVVPSIIFALKKMKAFEIILSNRTKEKAMNLKNIFDNLTVAEWGELPDFDMIINATSIGLKEGDKFSLDFKNKGENKFYYDVIYDPYKTDFYEMGNLSNNIFENGLNMFLYQAQKAFSIWHNVMPEINEEVFKLLKNYEIK
tara:strand:- start:1308 stop:2114 length:807 start_codon:yes stop_codon:yes gene_type:complete